MKKHIIVLLLLFIVCIMANCGKSNSPEVEIDYGTSECYTREDMDAAISLIKAEFDTWEGCELHSITYGTDESSVGRNLAWMNELETARGGNEPFTQCIMFKSDFHSPKENSGAWNPDTEYTDWQWWLARSDDGAWKLMTWGY